MTRNSSKTTPFLEGKRIFLRPLSRRDVNEMYLSWLNDPQVNQFNSHAIFPYTKEELVSYVKNASQDRSKVVLAIVDKKTDKHIGNIALQSIDWVARSAEFAIMIGEKSFWGKGVASEAGRLLVGYAFTRLHLRRIHCGTSLENIGMQKLAVKLGMKQEGRRRQAIWKNSQYSDVIEYGLIHPSSSD